MLEYLKKLDQEWFFAINGYHSDFWDPVMVAISERSFWFPFYALLAAYLIYRYRRQSILILLAVALALLGADGISSRFIKPYFARLRPCHDNSLSETINIVAGCGGRFGFLSSHAANTFAIAMLFAVILPRPYRYFKFFLFVWATAISYSRVYLGVHFPGDVLAGALLGILLGWLCGLLFHKLRSRYPYFAV
ncbi:MAG: putative membrane-associated phospholipid phosphatase [uncultured Adhaeribacter sp.]|uniref:Putative membrane-associated phospholipid phosphatase n=1 Tax=uncultured Adhaeribacter sp. TaxID=448109 RepID=A0A6J4JXF3_9BACT|nr:MAG: putative membrane-associated phospholipid phosphatase [uncultured Adhaeribacter sp.]